MKILLLAIILFLPILSNADDKKILLIAGGVTHGPGDHEFRAGSLLLQKCLEKTPGIQVEVHTDGWPKNDSAFEGVDVVFIYADGEAAHPAIQNNRSDLINTLEANGVGIICAHYAVAVPPGKDARNMLNWIGAYYEHEFSANPMWSPAFNILPTHPITKGVQPFQILDEWYFSLKFRQDTIGATTPILVASPSDAVRKGPYVWPKGPYQHIIDNSGTPEVMMWTYERPNGGRSVGFTGGHKHMNWGNSDFRKIVLNSILWAANEPVPEGGVESSVSKTQLLQNWDIKE